MRSFARFFGDSPRFREERVDVVEPPQSHENTEENRQHDLPIQRVHCFEETRVLWASHPGDIRPALDAEETDEESEQ